MLSDRTASRTATDGRTEPEAAVPRFARQRPFALILLLTGVVSWLAAGQLVLERIALYNDPNYVTSCDINPWISCGDVMKSWQAALFGFPNPLIGIVAFAVVITTAMAMFSGARFARWYWMGMQVGVTLGMVFIVWLWYQALFDLFRLCPYCMVVWAAMIVLFVTLTVRNIVHGVIRVPNGLRKVLSEWTWTIVALLIIATAASIFFRFIGVFTA